jgi:uncharacterized membrane protein
MSKLRIALAISIVLNLFLAGALASGFLTLRSGNRMINAGSLRIAGSELPVTVRRSFRAALREARQSMRPTIEESRAAKGQAAMLLRQPVLDQAGVLAALDRARTADFAVRAAVERRAVVYAAGLSPADRVTLADAMKRRSNKGQALTE